MLTRRNIDYKRSRIVRVIITFNNGNISYGTGFFINEHGLLLTCAHVVLGKDFSFVQQDTEFISSTGSNTIEKTESYQRIITNKIQIQLEDGSLKEVVLKKIDPNYDIASLQVNETDFNCLYLTTNKTNEPYYGQEISFYGFPTVLGHTYLNSPFVVNSSIVSTFPETIVAGGKYRHIQFNAITIGGISGAPIFKGNNNIVVGIINGNFHWAFNNIVSRNQNESGENNDSVWSTRVPLGIGYATSIKMISENTDIFSNNL